MKKCLGSLADGRSLPSPDPMSGFFFAACKAGFSLRMSETP